MPLINPQTKWARYFDSTLEKRYLRLRGTNDLLKPPGQETCIGGPPAVSLFWWQLHFPVGKSLPGNGAGDPAAISDLDAEEHHPLFYGETYAADIKSCPSHGARAYPEDIVA